MKATGGEEEEEEEEEEEPMQDPSNTSISGNGTPVEPTAAPLALEAAFPLPPDHRCDRQGVQGFYTGEWDRTEYEDLSYLIVQAAMQRLTWPLTMVQTYFSEKMRRIVEGAGLGPDTYQEFERYWQCSDDLITNQDELASRIATLTATHLPAKFGTIDQALQSAMLGAGLCCERAADALITSSVGEWSLNRIEKAIPEFRRDWLTLQGAKDHRDVFLEPRGPHPKQSVPASAKPQETAPPGAGQVSVLLTLKFTQPRDTSRWPAHMVIEDGAAAGMCWGFLDAMIETGAITVGEGSHILALSYREKEAPDWLPKAAAAGPWCSRVITPILRHSFEGADSDGQQLWPIEGSAARISADLVEPSRPKPAKRISPDTAQVTLRGKPVTKPTITLMDSGTLYDFATGVDHAPFFEANFKMEVADMEIDVFKNHHKSELLHEECGAIRMAGDVQVSGTLVNSGAEGQHHLMLLVDQWFPITEEADAAP